ncbi:multicopper oxidase domain-containing protein [Caulobacter sp. 17J65-9]|uniref:multicopper oxidase family protein n=1 Tax=Caulobacter sp. 17J65-9 TaxID=2709382 RepID=UPI0013C5450F|nr:multicopper oxidase domain-containing protein [Caulobacter sp. 17J65-9]NEX94887.1 multicopper oxidase domain-containing protein [Caulobacter sp. 17J65-9]
MNSRRALTRNRLLMSATFAAGLLVSGPGALARGSDVPTGAGPSPLFGATPFTTRMLLLEEFGRQTVPTVDNPNAPRLPQAGGCDRGPDGQQLDQFLAQPMSPLPQREANTAYPNPWAARIGQCVRPLATSAIEGRPPGEFFAHQRWSEFLPAVYAQTATAGARKNSGLRDAYQRHQYSVGEFGPGGLYHNAMPDNSGPGGTTNSIEIRFHPKMPVQGPNALWTFDGTFPPKLMIARYGEPVLFRQYNALPIDPAVNGGFGAHTLTTHHHNGHNPGESDGFTSAYFFPGQYYDYRWPMLLAGYDRINLDRSEPHAATPDGQGGTVRIPGAWREVMSTHWFHDHMLDFTAQNVYKGSAAMMNIYSAVDRGNETIGCNYAAPNNPNNVNLCLPSGSALDWGNRDYDVNLMIADKAWDKKGQLYFNIFNTDGFLGDRVTVNGQWMPYFDVRARRYRFRILNASVSRYYKIAIVTAAGVRVPFHMVANDGNIMEHAVAFPNAQSQDLPTQGIAERYDIVVDFKNYAPGTKIYFVNLAEHDDGRRPKKLIALKDALSSKFDDPAVGKFLELRVAAYSGVDRSMNPADYVKGKLTMVPLPEITPQEIAAARKRTFEFGRSNGTDNQPWTIKTDGGRGLNMDPHRVSAAPSEGSLEVWTIKNTVDAKEPIAGWDHPVHIHFEEGRILNRDGKAPPLWEEGARKDVYRIGGFVDAGQSLQVALRFREFMGTYMEHCHNTQHEDRSMLLRWDINKPGQLVYIPTPVPEWEGVLYEASFVPKN